jgi:hypothetical protein
MKNGDAHPTLFLEDGQKMLVERLQEPLDILRDDEIPY